MTRNSRAVLSPFFAGVIALCGCAAGFGAEAFAQHAPGPKGAAPETVKALMVSDIHFEPFWDPGKVAKLAAAPESGWKAILAAPDSADREQSFSGLEENCQTRGADTSYPLLASSLRAMRADAGGAKFITVSGDLMAHSFDCKYKALFPQALPGDYRAFVEKTIAFVMGELREAFPGVPVYEALGNNDSDCGDYQLDAHSAFLADTGKIAAADFPAPERKTAEEDFAAGGDFNAALPIPHTRMVVLDDVFMARKYKTCEGRPDAPAAASQIAWLKQQLDDARSQKEKVWVMAHIPPGVDPYSTAIRSGNLCADEQPQMFLSSEELAETLARYGDVIQLAIFAHTHMDELRLLIDRKSAGLHQPVAVKMVPSISPVDGNDPAFTVAAIDPASAMLVDYRVFAASNQTGVGTEWSEEYDYAKDYDEPAFSAPAVGDLVEKFAADGAAQTPVSESYLSHYFAGAGGRADELKLFWPMYVCALDHDEAEAYRECVCAGK